MDISGNLKKMFWINFFRNLFWLSSVITLFYINRGLGFTEIFLLGSISSVTILLLEVPTGFISDRYGKKRSLILSNIFLILFISLFLIADNFLVFAMAFIFAGASGALSSGSAEALIHDSLKEKTKKSMTRSIGRFHSAEVLAGIISPPIASIIAKDLLPWQFTILIEMTIISYILGLVLISTLKEAGTNEERPSIRSISALIKNRRLLFYTVNSSLVTAAMLSYMILWQPQFNLSNIPVELFGVMLAIGSLGIFLVNRYIDNITSRISPVKSLALSSIIPAIGFMILGLVFDPFLSIMLYLIIRVLASLRPPIFSGLMNNEIDSINRSTILSASSLFTAVFLIIIRPVIGILTDIGIFWGFAGLFVLSLSAGIMVLFGRKLFVN